MCVFSSNSRLISNFLPFCLNGDSLLVSPLLLSFRYQNDAKPVEVSVAVLNSMDNIRLVKLDTRLDGINSLEFDDDKDKKFAFRNATALLFGILIDDITIVDVRANNGQGGSNATTVSYEMRTKNSKEAEALKIRIEGQDAADWKNKLMDQAALKGSVTKVLPRATAIKIISPLMSVTPYTVVTGLRTISNEMDVGSKLQWIVTVEGQTSPPFTYVASGSKMKVKWQERLQKCGPTYCRYA